MTTYIALLRGINVSGQKRMPMADLARAFESLGFKKIRTYLQSGNVVFAFNSADATKIVRTIEARIEKKFGFSVSVILRTAEELNKIVLKNLLLNEPRIHIDKLHVTFLSEAPDKQALSSLEMKKDPGEEFIIKGEEVYLYCPKGYGGTKLSNTMFEKKLNLIATTRNWNTTKKLLELSNSEQ